MNYVSEKPLESIAETLFHPMGVEGVRGRSAVFEQAIEGLSALISRYREPGTEIFRFPPVMSRRQLEKSGYLNSFPQLLGSVCCLHGKEAAIRAAVERFEAGGQWTDSLAPTDLVLAPAACYPVYPIIAKRGFVRADGWLCDVACDCFRHEATHEIDRFQSFRMREYVCIGSSKQVVEFRERWMPRAKELAELLGLKYRIDQASDPFFGRAGKLMATSQVEQSLKFELLLPVRSEESPTACMSFNYHRDHFGLIWDLRGEDGEVSHTACVAFGMDRLGLALFAAHGVDLARWPASVRSALGL